MGQCQVLEELPSWPLFNHYTQLIGPLGPSAFGLRNFSDPKFEARSLKYLNYVLDLVIEWEEGNMLDAWS